MKLIVVKSPYPGVESVTLFTETKPEDFMLNHILNIIEDPDDAPDMIKARKYIKLPESVMVSDRKCCIGTPIKFKQKLKGVSNEQARTSSNRVGESYSEGPLSFKRKRGDYY